MQENNTVTVLLVESNQGISKLLSELLKKKVPGIEIKIVTSNAEAKIAAQKHSYFACVINVESNLDECLELAEIHVSKKIPSILIIDDIKEETRKQISDRSYIDYILKSSGDVYGYLARSLKALIRNSQTKVMVVDDSVVARDVMKNTLLGQLFTVLTAENGDDALKQIANHDDVKLIVTDYIMPEMDGFELTAKIRDKYTKDQIAIIAVSAAEGQDLTTERFLKYGANDYIKKPFTKQELICRVNNTMEYLSLIETQKKMANTDFLTGLFNRRYLMDTMSIFHANASRGHIEYVVALLDIDNFKTINDTYGHDFGDLIIKDITSALLESFRSSDIISRIGGEEFCVVLTNAKDQNIYQIFDKLREKISDRKIEIKDGNCLSYTVSIGICFVLGNTFEDMLKTADEMLYRAKRTGKNKVCPDF